MALERQGDHAKLANRCAEMGFKAARTFLAEMSIFRIIMRNIDLG
jgi:hypothetical protein